MNKKRTKKFLTFYEHNVLIKNMKLLIAQKANISSRFLDMLLSGKRNASSETARCLEKATGIPKEVWVFGSPAERRAAFNALKDVA